MSRVARCAPVLVIFPVLCYNMFQERGGLKAKVRCYECNRTYDYYEDGFCPRCGCFNQPPRASRIDENGNIVYHDGINEKNHTGSFVHKEYHAENRKRAFTKLETKPLARAPKKADPEVKFDPKVIGWIIFILFFFLEFFL